MPVLTFDQTVDIGHGRGRLSPAAAESLARVDAVIGRPADVNSAWRDPVLQDRMNRAWIAYMNGTGPRPNHGRALPAKDSIHCRGDAIDSDDAPGYKPQFRDEWEDNGWRFEVRDETWHGEYRSWLDKNIGKPAGGGGNAYNPADPEPEIEEEEDEDDMNGFYWHTDPAGPKYYFSRATGKSRLISKEEWDGLRGMETGARPVLPKPELHLVGVGHAEKYLIPTIKG